MLRTYTKILYTLAILLCSLVSIACPANLIADNEKQNENFKTVPFFEKNKKTIFKRKLRKNISTIFKPKFFINKSIFTNSDGCETITLQNNSTLKVQIISLDESTVSYTICDQPNSQEVTLELTSIKKISASNGDLIFQYNGDTDTNVLLLAIMSLSVGILALLLPVIALLLGPLAIVLGISSKKKAKKNTNKDQNKAISTAGIILGILSTLISIIIVAIFLFTF